MGFRRGREVFENHLVAFIDLLGVRSLVRSSDAERLDGLVSLLRNLKLSESDPAYGTERVDDHSRTYFTNLGVSAFSDSILLSFSGIDSTPGIGLPLFELARQIGGVFTTAMRFGCLIRGGITVGPLFHSDGAVCG